MKTSRAGLAVLKEYEGLRLRAYLCPAGVWTIGYGHTSNAGAPVVVPGTTISEAQAEEILVRDLSSVEASVDRLVTRPLSQGQFDALVSFVYNLGEGAFARSTLLKKINAGRIADVPAELMKWTRAGGVELSGLVRRRRAEAKLWRGLDTSANVSTLESRATPDVPAKKSIVVSREANGAVAAGTGGAIAVAQEVIPVLRDGGDLLASLTPTVIICVGIVLLAAAIWYWRKQRLEEE